MAEMMEAVTRYRAELFDPCPLYNIIGIYTLYT